MSSPMINTGICIIDDNTAVCESLKFLLESFLNISVRTYSDPLFFLQEFLPDWKGCLLIDLMMPSMNGIDLIRELKKMNESIQVIIISGHGTAETAAKALAAGASAFITKPFKTEYLLEKIIHILGSVDMSPGPGCQRILD